MKELKTKHGTIFKVDDDDYELLKDMSFFMTGRNRNYVTTWMDGKNKKVHRIVTGVQNPKILIDHRDRDTLNNQKDNLRQCTTQQNSFNQKNKNGRLKGATFYKPNGKWASKIRFNNRLLHLGYFNTDTEAHEAYKIKARELFGEFAL